jgi:hypothetical protein
MAQRWERYGDCSKCGIAPGQPCVATGDRYSLLWPPPLRRPHRDRGLSEDEIDAMADDGRLGVIAKRLAIEANHDWSSLDGDDQDAWHERAIDLLRSGKGRWYANDAAEAPLADRLPTKA